jgi:O-antigen/teichoic acid export membrane protein
MVLMPRAGGKKSPAALKGFVRRCYRNLAVLVVPLILPVFLFKPFLLLLARFKADYIEFLPSFGVFVILYAAGLLSLAIIPMRSALYALELPRVDSYLEAAGVVLMVVGGIVLIPTYGYIGAAIMALVVRALALVGLLAYGIVKLRQLDA